MDADMLVLKDIREVWEAPFDGATVLHCPSARPDKYQPQFSMMLLDCASLTWKVDEIITEGLDAGRFDYDQLIKGMCIEPKEKVRASLPYYWNSLELYEPGKTGNIHYTEMKRQPWLNARNRIGHVWVKYLKDALADGWVTREEVREAQAKGFARPSLLKQVDEVPPAFWRIWGETRARRIDDGFVPHNDLETRKQKVIAQGVQAAGTPGTNA